MIFEGFDEEPVEDTPEIIPEEKSKEWDEEENSEPKEELPSDSGGNSDTSPLWTEPMGGSTIHFTPTESTGTVYYTNTESYSMAPRRSGRLRRFFQGLREFWNSRSRYFGN